VQMMLVRPRPARAGPTLAGVYLRRWCRRNDVTSRIRATRPMELRDATVPDDLLRHS
jgi:hypothetical protein